MKVINKVTRNMLIKMAETLSFGSQSILRLVEDEIAKEFNVNLFNNVDEDIKHYLLLTSLPFSFTNVDINLEDLWHLDCRKCKTVIYRKTMPTGNLNPEYFIVGDAPGVGDGEKKDRFDRVWVYGQSSHLLRKALLDISVYFDCWFTNLLKCSTPKNRPSTDMEVKACTSQLETEIKLLKPKKILLLGRNVQSMFPDFGVPRTNIPHPTWFVRKGFGYKEYAKIISKSIL